MTSRSMRFRQSATVPLPLMSSDSCAQAHIHHFTMMQSTCRIELEPPQTQPCELVFRYIVSPELICVQAVRETMRSTPHESSRLPTLSSGLEEELSQAHVLNKHEGPPKPHISPALS